MTRSRFTPLALLGACILAGTCLEAQTHKVAAPQTVVRALGVYEWTGDLTKPTASRLIPISLYIDGHFEEAGLYLARPVPFALDSGFAYSIEDAGISHGMLNLISAARLNGNAQDYDDPWIGSGRFVPPAAEPKGPDLKQSRTLATLVATHNSSVPDDPDRPHLVNRSPPDTSTPASTSSPSSSTASSAPASSSPTLHPSPDPSTTASTSSPSSTSSTDNTDVDRPTLHRPTPEQEKANQKKANDAKKKAGQSSVSSPDRPLTDDPDRPTLRRHSADSNDSGAAELIGLPADMRQMTAVSDASARPEHNFARAWDDENEHTTILKQMQDLAREQLIAYEKANPLPAGADTTTVVHAATPTTTQTPATVVSPDNGAPKLQRGVPQGYGKTSTFSSGTTGAAATAPAQTGTASSSSASPSSSTQSAAQSTAKTSSTAATTSAAARRRAATRKTPPPPPPPEPLLDEQLHGYELSYGGDPTFVYTAHTAGTGVAERFVTLVTEEDPATHQLQVVLHSVTDDAHRDRTPEMRPLDAVDADASNRASLLIEMRSQNSRQFALYRVLSGRADQIFLTGTTR